VGNSLGTDQSAAAGDDQPHYRSKLLVALTQQHRHQWQFSGQTPKSVH
jgi:hypothetical protein